MKHWVLVLTTRLPTRNCVLKLKSMY
ncbi:hypothetical protein V12B01_13230 [Vibrio splendidus 12B01]|nr:hypothetical protein V12B01_13230 [Vibrio splendidus 12B01]